MKNGTLYAARLKKFYAKIRQGREAPPIPEPDDPVRRLAVGILGVGRGDEEGARAVDQLLSEMADWNEVRVSRPLELARAIGDSSAESVARCQRLATALQSVFRQENRLTLDRLRILGRRESKQYLENLAGMDEYAVASVVLWSLGGHAIPASDALMNALGEADLIDPSATRAEVQAFLERHVNATEAKEFCLNMNAYALERRPAARSRAVGVSRAGGK